MAVKAETILEHIKKEEQEKLKSIIVEKDIDLEFDLGNLLACDANPFDAKLLKSKREDYLKSLARENAQLLFNNIWKLPVERVQDVIIAKLPTPQTVLPREKPVPKPKPPTKWEEYAKLKGIKKRKRDRMIWDDKSQSWRPRYGYKRANDDTKAWVLEVPKNADPNEDQFEKKLKEKRERVAKNELQRLRNIARQTGKKVPGVGQSGVIPEGQRPTSSELEQSFHQAKISTASLGRFEGTIKNEKPQKNRNKKRKFEPLITTSSEKDKQMEILNQMYKRAPQININKAVNREISGTPSSNVRRMKKSGGKRGDKKFAKGKKGKK